MQGIIKIIKGTYILTGMVVSFSFMISCTNENSFEKSGSTNFTSEEPIDDSIVTDNSFEAIGTVQQCIRDSGFQPSIPNEVQNCINQGPNSMWNFFQRDEDPSTCIEMNTTSFDCNFDNLITATSDLFGDENHPGTQELISVKDTAILIACAQNNEGRTYVAQFIKFSEESINQDCSVNPSQLRITTRCYQQLGENAPPPTTDAEIESQRTRECLN
tara:strand:+ start:147 stop:794 length:648 start_codon:yes stop_codon:yes gene_type:complete